MTSLYEIFQNELQMLILNFRFFEPMLQLSTTIFNFIFSLAFSMIYHKLTLFSQNSELNVSLQ